MLEVTAARLLVDVRRGSEEPGTVLTRKETALGVIAEAVKAESAAVEGVAGIPLPRGQPRQEKLTVQWGEDCSHWVRLQTLGGTSERKKEMLQQLQLWQQIQLQVHNWDLFARTKMIKPV